MLRTKIEPAKTERDPDEEQREVAQAELEGRLRLAVSQPHGDRPELGTGAGPHDDAEACALRAPPCP